MVGGINMLKLLFFFVQKMLDSIVITLNFLFSWLPNSPFDGLVNSQYGELLGKINYFVPVYDFIVITQAWLVAVSLFYAYSIIARWLKAIQ